MIKTKEQAGLFIHMRVTREKLKANKTQLNPIETARQVEEVNRHSSQETVRNNKREDKKQWGTNFNTNINWKYDEHQTQTITKLKPNKEKKSNRNKNPRTEQRP